MQTKQWLDEFYGESSASKGMIYKWFGKLKRGVRAQMVLND